MIFASENNKGIYRYIQGTFEEFLSIIGPENALRLARLVNILRRNLLEKI